MKQAGGGGAMDYPGEVDSSNVLGAKDGGDAAGEKGGAEGVEGEGFGVDEGGGAADFGGVVGI